MKSSFVRKGKAAASAPALPSGTRLSAQNGSLQISSGLSDFDGTIKALNSSFHKDHLVKNVINR